MYDKVEVKIAYWTNWNVPCGAHKKEKKFENFNITHFYRETENETRCLSFPRISETEVIFQFGTDKSIDRKKLV